MEVEGGPRGYGVERVEKMREGGTREGWGRGNEGKWEARVGGGIGGDCWSW